MRTAYTTCTLILLAGVALAADPAQTPFFEQRTIAAAQGGSQNCWPCMARLSDGRLLVLWARAAKGSNDYAIVGAFSGDSGRTWTAPRTFIDNEGVLDADPSLVVSGRRILVTTTSWPKGETKIRVSNTFCVRSEDGGATWSAPYQIPMQHRYTCGKTHHGLRLKSGTLLMGYSWDVPCEQGKALTDEGQMDLRAGVMRSTDDGLTWTPAGDTHATYERAGGGGAVSGTDEPAIVELPDGSIYMLMRTGSAHLYEARSTDDGLTWKDVRPSPLRGSNAPAALSGFVDEGRFGILAVWDNALQRFPLCAAVSFDGGRTWSRPRDIGFPYPGGGQASYPACEQASDGTLIAVWQQDGPNGRDIRSARFNAAWLKEDMLTEIQKERPNVRLPDRTGPQTGFPGGVDPSAAKPAWTVHRDGGKVTASGALRLVPMGGYYIDNQQAAWDGSRDKLIEVRMRVVDRERTAPGNHSAAELWIGGPQPNAGCMLFFREDAVSFDESYTPACPVDARQFHTYRIVTNHKQGRAYLFVDEGKEPALVTYLTGPYGYNINRILFGDSGGAKDVSGTSEWVSVRWSDVEPSAKPLVIVAFGDSTTAPRGPLRTFSVLLQEEMGREEQQVVVINAGIGGHNTDQGRERFARDVLGNKPDVVTIWFGLNDAAVDVWKGATEPRLAKARYEENLRYFVRALRSAGAKPILMTPNPSAWTAELKKLYGKPPLNPNDPDGYNVVVSQYAAVVRTVAESEKVPLVDVYRIFEDYAGPDKDRLHNLLLDGMHPNDRGHRIIADCLMRIVGP
jgi:lysophospholipase L1-like esterase